MNRATQKKRKVRARKIVWIEDEQSSVGAVAGAIP